MTKRLCVYWSLCFHTCSKTSLHIDKLLPLYLLRKQRTENICKVLLGSEMEWCKLCVQITPHISVVVLCLYMLFYGDVMGCGSM